MRKHTNVFLTLCTLLFLFLVSACGYGSAAPTASGQSTNQTTTTTATLASRSTATTIPTPTPTAAPSLKQILKNSSKVMHQLQSLHFTIDAKRQDVTNAGVSAGSAASLLQALQPLSGQTSHNMWKQGQGDEDSASGKSQITLGEKTAPPTFDMHDGAYFAMNQRIHGNSVYLFGGLPTKQSWYVIDKQTLLNQTNPHLYDTDPHLYVVSGIEQIRALINLAVQDGALSDKGSETLGGNTLHHIQITLSKQGRETLRDIDVENYSAYFASLQTANTQGSIDFWIDDQSGYVYKLASSLIFQTNDSRILPSTIQQTLVFNCSNFNQPVSITLPQQAIPATSIDPVYPIIPS